MNLYIVKTPDGLSRVYGDYWEISPTGTLWIRTQAQPAKDVAFNQFYWQKISKDKG